MLWGGTPLVLARPVVYCFATIVFAAAASSRMDLAPPVGPLTRQGDVHMLALTPCPTGPSCAIGIPFLTRMSIYVTSSCLRPETLAPPNTDRAECSLTTENGRQSGG